MIRALDLKDFLAPSLPDPEPDGRIRTLNKMGCATLTLDHISKAFVEYCRNAKKPVLDGGAAYGMTTIAALKAGATVIANDLCKEHLLFIAANKELTEDDKARLYLYSGELPNGMTFEDESLSAIHLCRVMHFFAPESVQGMFVMARKWLEPEGKLFITTMSPYHSAAEGFFEVYQERTRNGEKWPGLINEFTVVYGQQHAATSPTFLHAIDPNVMKRLATEHDFSIDQIELFGGPQGKDYTGVILTKKSR